MVYSLDIERTNLIIRSERDNAVAFYDANSGIMVSVPKKTHPDYGNVACYTLDTNAVDEDKWGWQPHQQMPEWVDVAKSTAIRAWLLEPEFSLEEIERAQSVYQKIVA